MIKKKASPPSFFQSFFPLFSDLVLLLFSSCFGPSAGTYFLIAAAYHQLNIGRQNIGVSIGEGLHGSGVDIDSYRKDIAIGVHNDAFFHVRFFPPPVCLQLYFLPDVGFHGFSYPGQSFC